MTHGAEHGCEFDAGTTQCPARGIATVAVWPLFHQSTDQRNSSRRIAKLILVGPILTRLCQRLPCYSHDDGPPKVGEAKMRRQMTIHWALPRKREKPHAASILAFRGGDNGSLGTTLQSKKCAFFGRPAKTCGAPIDRAGRTCARPVSSIKQLSRGYYRGQSDVNPTDAGKGKNEIAFGVSDPNQVARNVDQSVPARA
jgi:hypothetical protein